MPHIVQIQTEVRDVTAIGAACRRLGLPSPVQETLKLSRPSTMGLAVQLRGWQFAIVCDVQTGRIEYDNVDAHWDNPVELDRFLQAYTVEKVKIKMHQLGYSFMERERENGAIRLTFWMSDDDE